MNEHGIHAFLYRELGEVRYNDLVLRANTPVKRSKAEREEMYQHYKAQLQYCRRRRMDGETGLIEFVEWD